MDYYTPERYTSRIACLQQRLDTLIAAGVGAFPRSELAQRCRLAPEVFADKDARRLCKRLRDSCDHIFTFLEHPQAPFDNNFAERMIRPAVILRKNSQSNRSEQGAATQAVLMSLCRTLKLRGLDPTRTIANALKTYAETASLPPIPGPSVADG